MGVALLLWQLVGQATAAEDPAERLARLETQVVFLGSAIDRIETKLDNIAASQHSSEQHEPLKEQWPTALLTILIVLDKAGYYLRRKPQEVDNEG